jgi:hypothetical protein
MIKSLTSAIDVELNVKSLILYYQEKLANVKVKQLYYREQ